MENTVDPACFASRASLKLAVRITTSVWAIASKERTNCRDKDVLSSSTTAIGNFIGNPCFNKSAKKIKQNAGAKIRINQ